MSQIVILGAALALLGGCSSPLPPAAAQARVATPAWIDANNEQSCAAMAHAESYLCRADRRLMAARTQGDAQAVECLSARGRELRATYRTLTDTQDEQIRRAAEASLAHKLDMLEDCETGPRRAPDSVRVLAPVLADLEDAPGRGWTAQ